jgi:hypothetical protein
MKKSFFDFISYQRRSTIKESLLRSSLKELIEIRKTYDKYDKPFAPYGSLDKQRARQTIWDLDALIDAHNKANQHNSNL